MNFVSDASSNTALLVAGCLVAAAVLVAVWRKLSTPASDPAIGRPRALDAVDTIIGWPPEPTRVLTIRHQRAFEILRRAVPNHLIFAQVPLSHFIKVPTRHSYVEWLRRVGHVCVDLMVCDAASNVIAIIEVRQNEKIDSERARKRHQRTERVLKAAGIPLHVWHEAYLPDPLAVRKALFPQEATAAANTDQGPDTSPLDGRPRAPRELPWHPDPPRSTWFDDINATQPVQLDGVDVAIDIPDIAVGAAPSGVGVGGTLATHTPP